ncbi:MAG TPA: alpha/beta hydrolase [Candidatus Binataceae bacterium]|nr:alpha/beta hydrolase [Candidatus Binataceae bacterium]
MPLDPQMKSLLDAMAAANIPAFHTLSPQEARRIMGARRQAGKPEPIAKVEDRAIRRVGGEIPVRIYTPAAKGPLGALIYFHGGGWVLGDIEMTDQPCRMLANRAGCVVVSVDYRLAPEHKFPAGPDDCYTATRWVSENAGALGVDSARLAVGGTSAGATLAAVVALMARDRGGPRIAHQLLVYPATTTELTTGSHREFAADKYYVLSRSDMEWFWGHYLAGDADRTNHYACPAYAKTLRGLPPAFVITAEYDPLRDEGEAYAARLREEGVAAELKRYAGVTHGFFGMPDQLDISKAAIAEASTKLRAAIGG